MPKPSSKSNKTKSNPTSRKAYGFEMSDLKEAQESALLRGKTLAREVKMSGNSLREWATKTSKETTKLIQRIKKDPIKFNQRVPIDEFGKLLTGENEISRMIRIYFGEVSNNLVELKNLNPPLQTKQITPFLNEILDERRLTLSALEPLTKSIDEINKIKRMLSLESSAVFRL